MQVQVNRLIPNSPNNLWFDLQGVPTGSIHLEISFNPFAQPSPRGQQQVNYNPATFIPQPGPYQAPPQQPGGYPQQQYNAPYGQQQQQYPPQGYPPAQTAPQVPPVPTRGIAGVYNPSEPVCILIPLLLS